MGFLAAIFGAARSQLQKTESDYPDKMSYKDVALRFRNLFENKAYRDEFFEAVIQRHKGRPTMTSGALNEEWEALAKEIGQITKGSELPEGALVVLSIDEVFFLGGQDSDYSVNTKPTRFSKLKSAIAELSTKKFVALFLGTTTPLSMVAPPRDQAPSAREQAAPFPGHSATTPFTVMPLDTGFIDDPLIPGKYKVDEVTGIDLLAKFGRPLLVQFIG